MSLTASTDVQTDGDLLAAIEALPERPSRNAVMKEFGVGASRAARLLTQLSGPVTPVQPEPVQFTVEPAPAPELPALPVRPEPESAQERTVVQPVPEPDWTEDRTGPAEPGPVRSTRWLPWVVGLIALPAAVAIWSGWVGLGGLTGFGPVHLLPGIADDWSINSAITLPVGVEAYAALALRVWLTGGWPVKVARYAKRSAIGSLVLGACGQVAYHLMAAARVTSAPWWITTLVACLPVAVLGMASGLVHLTREETR